MVLRIRMRRGPQANRLIFAVTARGWRLSRETGSGGSFCSEFGVSALDLAQFLRQFDGARDGLIAVLAVRPYCRIPRIAWFWHRFCHENPT